MGKGLRLLSHGAALKWTVVQGLVDYRRRGSNLSLTDRAEWLHVWCAKLLERFQIERKVYGTAPASGLVVSNHLSYLDILVFSAEMPCIFVSKAEVRDWPVFGMITTMSGTVYVDRTRRSDTRNANDGIRNALQQGLRVVIFPEGTSTDGSEVLPFYPSLLEPAVEGATPITAANLSYRVKEGSVGNDVAYWGEMTFFPHLLRMLSLRKIEAELRFAGAPRTFSDRKTAAVAMRGEVIQLGNSVPAEK